MFRLPAPLLPEGGAVASLRCPVLDRDRLFPDEQVPTSRRAMPSSRSSRSHRLSVSSKGGCELDVRCRLRAVSIGIGILWRDGRSMPRCLRSPCRYRWRVLCGRRICRTLEPLGVCRVGGELSGWRPGRRKYRYVRICKEVELTVMEGMRKLVRESAGTMSTLRRAKHRSHAKIDALNA